MSDHEHVGNFVLKAFIMLWMALLAVLALPARAAPQAYEIDSSHTSAGYELEHAGLSMQQGRFSLVSGKIVVDEESGAGLIDATIDANSLHTDLSLRDWILKGKNFFNVARFPTLTFKSNALQFQQGRLVRVDGVLTLLGVSRPVTLEVTHFAHARNPANGRDSYGVNAETRIRRSDYGMKAYLPLIGDDVKLSIALEAVKAE